MSHKHPSLGADLGQCCRHGFTKASGKDQIILAAVQLSTHPAGAVHDPSRREFRNEQVLGPLAIELQQVDLVDPDVGEHVSHGHASPEGFWYDQDEHEWVMVLQGAARLQLEDRTIDLGHGDYINLPAHTKHRVQWTTTDQPTIWLAIFYKSLAFPTFDIPVSNE